MGVAKEHRPVKLFVGMFTGREGLFETARAQLGKAYGAVDHVSPVWPFDFTTYYAEEFGDNLLRQFIALARMRAMVVLPTPRVTVKRYAWATRPDLIALTKVWAIGSWPTTSSKVRLRYLRASTRYPAMMIFDLRLPIGHYSHPAA